MIQEILTYIIVGWAFIQTGRFFWKSILTLKNNDSACSISGGCSGCAGKQSLLKEIKVRKGNTDTGYWILQTPKPLT